MVIPLKNIWRWIWANTDPLTKWLQVVAVIVTAGWVFFRFNRDEAPSLELRSSVQSSIGWALRPDSSPPSCAVNYTVTVKNDGVTSFDVEKVHIQVWRYDPPQPKPGKPVFLDTREVQKGDSVIDILPPSTLRRHFSPQQSTWQSFEWLWASKPKPGLYVFQAIIEDRHGTRLGLAETWTDHFAWGRRRPVITP